MNRKLQHTLKALSATAAVFTVLLVAGGPATPPSPMGLASNVSVQLTGDGGTLDGAIDASEATPSSASQRRHRRHSRELLALPYFSFAQGLRRTRS